MPKLKLKHFRLNQNFGFFYPAGRLFMNYCTMVCLNINVHIPVPYLRLQLGNGLMGLRELSVLHWQSLAELGLEKTKQTEKNLNKNTSSA